MAGRASRVSTPAPLTQLTKRIAARKARIGVIGLGYVGLPLAVEFATEGFTVTGIELDRQRVNGVNAGRSYIPDVTSETIVKLIRSKRLLATSTYEHLASLDAIIICVPTPLRKTGEPDISFILAAAKEISAALRPGHLIILESTTYPGTTDEALLPMLEVGGLKVGKDFSLAFSPERIDPGNAHYSTRTIPKVVGGITPTCQKLAVSLYSSIIKEVVPVSSTKVAEMVKLLENTFRAVNIGLVNEIALICDRLGVNVWEVIEAAKTKPFGFMPFYPGPGIGGHCIPKDPMYLAWKARVHGFDAKFIQLADQINRYMPHYVVDKVGKALNAGKRTLNGSRILLIGLAYKQDVNDTRDSPVFDVAKTLSEGGAQVRYHDPYVPTAQLNGQASRSIALTAEQLKRTDCVVILTDHSGVDYELILRTAPLIVDTRNHYRGLAPRPAHVVTL